MKSQRPLRDPKRKRILELSEALSSSLDLHEVLKEAFPVLTKLIATDYGSICVSRSCGVGSYDWITIDFPVDWFSAYPEMAPHDFVRESVMKRPNVVLRDSDMLPRRELEANMMYRRARDQRVPLEHVMSVLLDFHSGWHAGINLYRGTRDPFSQQDTVVLQELTRSFANAIRNCKAFSASSAGSSLLDTLLSQHGIEAVVFSSKLIEIVRTEGLAPLVERWFNGEELDGVGLPIALMEEVRKTLLRHKFDTPPFMRLTKLDLRGAELSVTLDPIPRSAHKDLWALCFRERPVIPLSWRRLLRPREQEVATRVILGWDNLLISQDLGCKVTTVKKHLERVFDALGVSSRSALCHLAGQKQ